MLLENIVDFKLKNKDKAKLQFIIRFGISFIIIYLIGNNYDFLKSFFKILFKSIFNYNQN